MRELHRGGIEFALPGVEHWHGASPTEGARHINQGLRIDGGTAAPSGWRRSARPIIWEMESEIIVQNEISGNWRTLK